MPRPSSGPLVPHALIFLLFLSLLDLILQHQNFTLFFYEFIVSSEAPWWFLIALFLPWPPSPSTSPTPQQWFLFSFLAFLCTYCLFFPLLLDPKCLSLWILVGIEVSILRLCCVYYINPHALDSKLKDPQM